ARLGAQMQLFARGLIRAALRLPTGLSILAMLVAVPMATLIALAAWLLLGPLFFARIMPITATRYVLTNKALKVLKGWSGRVVQELPLTGIDAVPGGDFPDVAVRVVEGSVQDFYQAADLEVRSGGQVALVLRGVKEYEQFRRAIYNAWLAWGRKEMPKEQVHPASEAEAKK
ncbi:MAG: PH domain-containing protein, partial [Gemmatales bacterium]|nr:PH domain-containing protein [Gemmatales bacterium]MDW8175947.1 PH domain-containing protein [Gemmatales bacterium]